MPKTTGRAAATAAEPANGVRTLHLTNPLMTGPDVEALQTLLAPYNPGTVDGEYGPATSGAVRRAKLALGYPPQQVNGAAGELLVSYLDGSKKLPPDFAARRAARKHDAAKALTIRKHIVANARWGIAHEPDVHYEQLRPMEGLREARKLPLHTDCSGFSTLCYAWAGAPDPNGVDYDGTGYTGTLLRHMEQIPLAAVQPGDLVVWGPGTGHHVALVLETDGRDPLLCSHGQEKGPLEIRFSVESRYQPSPAIWLALPDWAGKA
jgi:peptidoglycan hydrolase-like protein with peptidoglycan-binding domain